MLAAIAIAMLVTIHAVAQTAADLGGCILRRNRLSGLLVIPVLLASLLLSGSPALAQGTLDQSQTVHDAGIGATAEVRFAQTFTAGITGDLDTIKVYTHDPIPAATVEIRTVSDGAPSGTVLATTEVDASLSETWVTVAFAAPATVTAGTPYAIVLRLPGSSFLGVSASSDRYPRGHMWYRFEGDTGWTWSDDDLAFRTFVTIPKYGFAWTSPTKGKGHGVNRPRAGTTVAVTFTLDTKVSVSKLLAPSWPKVRRVDCSTHQPKAGTEWMSRPFGAKGLTRDGRSYTYSWRVRSEWGDGPLACRELRIKLTDGTTHSALYQFRKAK